MKCGEIPIRMNWISNRLKLYSKAGYYHIDRLVSRQIVRITKPGSQSGASYPQFSGEIQLDMFQEGLL